VKLEAWMVGITAGSKGVPGRKGLRQETMIMMMMMMKMIMMMGYHTTMLMSQNSISVARKLKLYTYQSMFPSIIWSVNITFLCLQNYFLLFYIKTPPNAFTHFMFCWPCISIYSCTEKPT